MSEYQKGQAVTYTNPRGQKKAGQYVGKIDKGPGRGGGTYLLVNVGGKEVKAKPAQVKAA